MTLETWVTATELGKGSPPCGVLAPRDHREHMWLAEKIRKDSCVSSPSSFAPIFVRESHTRRKGILGETMVDSCTDIVYQRSPPCGVLALS